MAPAIHPDLQPYVFEDVSLGPCLHHPLIIALTIRPPAYGELSERYLGKRDAVARAQQESDWSSFVFLHERPYRIHALLRLLAQGLAGADYWRMVGAVWIDSENIRQDFAIWRKLWGMPPAGREAR